MRPITSASNTNCVGEIVDEAAACQLSGREVTADLLFLAAPTGFEPVSPPWEGGLITAESR